ncbi:superoxide dismutase family protein [Roseiconus lacunae]|uniref:superoxide dismutase family protein n=1 Tax=Roseiconus lacunae TaxID=2605694 RepID=UPI001E57C9C8|nr:superoxide dismutase family protein [Roseiconus lacunae]MCD0462914.1 superoxide dismutase family protein [Roseiconus lacunae]
MKRFFTPTLFTLAFTSLAACLAIPSVSTADHHEEGAHATTADVDIPKQAVAVLFPTEGNDVRGVVLMEQKGSDIALRGKVINLTPGKHGFHIHQYGDLRSVDGKSAGGHYAPGGHDHGGPDSDARHAGDLGNITADQEGVAEFSMTVKKQQVHLLLGRAIVVHGGEDDLKSQPSGNAGPRVSLGVIGVANEEHGS